jgi:hypothetical protein
LRFLRWIKNSAFVICHGGDAVSIVITGRISANHYYYNDLPPRHRGWKGDDTMVSFEKLHQQNHKITELTNILEHLLGDRSLCDSQVTCNLFFDYVSAVKEHLAITDSGMYSQLLSSGDQKLSNVANRFMGGSREINRIFSGYLKRWCKVKRKELVIREYDKFMQDTEEMFRLVLDRIQDETEHLYPAVKKVMDKAA